jgi:hypothetical protein
MHLAMTKHILYIALLSLIAFSCRKSNYYLEDENLVSDLGAGTGTVTWTSDQSYLIDGFVFVNDGQTLTIEAGVVIRAKTGQGNLASALIVARGGKIIAQGTSDNPIVFTVEGDDLEGSVPLKSKGLWGGLIILGNAPINTESGEGFIEGIPISEPRGVYGGNIVDDNSGILEYVSILHGGTNIGEDNEINGLTLGGVGNKTTIDHVEVISNADDGVEIFGGTVNCSNLAVAFCGDDAFDFDEGYKGKCQYLLGIKDTDTGDHLVEHSGNSSGYLSSETTLSIVYNSTFINFDSSTGYIMSFDHYSGGIYRNSLFLGNIKGIGIEFDDYNGCYAKLKDNDISISNNIFYGIADNNTDSLLILDPDDGATMQDIEYVSSYAADKQNTITDPGLNYENIPLNLLPPTTVFENMASYSDEWFEVVTYKGAFGSNNWLEGWSLLWKEGIIE